MEIFSETFFIILAHVMLFSNMGTEYVTASPVGDSFVNYKLDGGSLISMGRALNNSLLTLLGLTIDKQEKRMNKTIPKAWEKLKEEIKRNNDEKNLKGITTEFENKIEAVKEEGKLMKSELCKLKSCTEWTEWSTCSAEQILTFGVRSRSRTCGTNSHFCLTKSAGKLESDDQICQGKQETITCPSTYTSTTNQFCIRVRNDMELSWEDAEAQCNQDGGHLINIDSDLKIRDINRLLETMSLPDYTFFWIDGEKTSQNTKWQFRYGSENIGLSAWYNGEPASSDVRIIYYKVSGKWYLYGVNSGPGNFICEIF